MTKPREKTREELQAEIEDGKKKIRQLENREKNHQAEAIRRGTQGEKPQALQARRLHGKPGAGAYCHAGRGCADLFPACPDERASTGVFEKTSRGNDKLKIP